MDSLAKDDYILICMLTVYQRISFVVVSFSFYSTWETYLFDTEL